MNDFPNPCMKCLLCICFFFTSKNNKYSQPQTIFFFTRISNTNVQCDRKHACRNRLPRDCLVLSSVYLLAWNSGPGACFFFFHPLLLFTFFFFHSAKLPGLGCALWCCATPLLEQGTAEGRERLLKVLKKKV